MALTPGTRLGTYEIITPLGAGGMGEVYRARDTRLGREIAVKVLPHDVATSPERLARFEHEAKAVASLNHPNIVTLHSIEEVGGIRFLTMELVDGRCLSTLVAAGGLPFAQVLDLAIPITEALTAAHERGIVHRDLKPTNVMVTREGRIKVLDFGLAKRAALDEDSERSQAATVVAPISGAGVIVGTVPYMAPEQILGEPVDARTDLFALGILLYELAVGKRPFAGETHVDISHAILRGAPKPLAAVRGDLPVDLDRIVSRCLEKNPRARFQTALDVSNELRRLRRELERSGSGTPTGPTEKLASIAVLPFVNRSASADDEYFSDGLADELLNVLAKIKGLRVTARTSSFHFKGKDTTIAEIGRALDVATVLEGSVRKAGNRIRVSVQLVNVSDSSQLWSDTYDRTLNDIFAVQDDIAQSVVKELRTMLLGKEADSNARGQAKAEVARAAIGRGTDPEAHRLYLLARHLLDRVTREDTRRSIEYLERALERDPRFALAWAMLSWAYAREADTGWAPIAESYSRARRAVERALVLEPDMPEGHAAMGWIQISYDWDWRGAERSFARALELAPGNTTVLRMASGLAWSPAHIDEGISLCQRAVEQDPLSGPAYHNLGLAFHAADRLAEAEVAFRRARELSPHRSRTRANLALAILAQGRREEALAEAMNIPEGGSRLWALAIVHHDRADPSSSNAALEQLIEKHGHVAAYQVAEVCAARGEPDAAFEWLERAYAQRDGGLSHMISPYLRPLHGDARWNAFLKKMGFE